MSALYDQLAANGLEESHHSFYTRSDWRSIARIHNETECTVSALYRSLITIGHMPYKSQEAFRSAYAHARYKGYTRYE